MEQNTTASEGGGRGSSNTRSDFASSDARARSSALASSSSSSSSSNKSDSNAGNETKNNATTLTTTTETPRNTNHHQSKKTLPARTLLGLTVSGVCAGVFVETLFYPLDTIKTRLQAARGGGGGGGNANLFKGVFNGLSKNIAGCVPATALFFLAYEPTKRYLERTLPPEQNYAAMFAAGATGCLASSIVRVPTEVIKTRAQTGNRVQSLGGILRASGISRIVCWLRFVFNSRFTVRCHRV